MKRRYRIHPETERDRLSDADIAGHRDARRLFFAYQRATRPLYHRPLYKDPRTFLAILLIVLLAYLISGVLGRDQHPTPEALPERSAP